MGKEKSANKGKSFKNEFLKAREILKKICYECGISFEEMFPQYTAKNIDEMKDLEFKEATSEMKQVILTFVDEYFIENWSEIIRRSYDKEKQQDEINIISILIGRDPIQAFDYYSNMFKCLNGLSSDNEEDKVETLLNISEDASNLSTEELINRYFELTKSKFKDEVMIAINDGISRNKRLKSPLYITSCFTRTPQRGE